MYAEYAVDWHRILAISFWIAVRQKSPFKRVHVFYGAFQEKFVESQKKKKNNCRKHDFKAISYQFSPHFSMVDRTSAPVVRLCLVLRVNWGYPARIGQFVRGVARASVLARASASTILSEDLIWNDFICPVSVIRIFRYELHQSFSFSRRIVRKMDQNLEYIWDDFYEFCYPNISLWTSPVIFIFQTHRVEDGSESRVLWDDSYSVKSIYKKIQMFHYKLHQLF